LQISEDDYKKNFVEKSFYKDDIDKVVFLSAPFTGSDMAALASLRAYVLGGVQWDKGTELLGNARTYYDLILAALDMKKKQEELSDLERRLPGLTRDPGLVNTLFIPYLIDDIAKNGMRFTPEMYYPVFSNYAFYRVMNSQVRQSGGWTESRDMFHDLAPNGDPLTAIRHPAFWDMLPAWPTVWRYSNADIEAQYNRPIMKVGYGLGMPVGTFGSIADMIKLKLGANIAADLLFKNPFTGKGASFNDTQLTNLGIMANSKWQNISSNTGRQFSLWNSMLVPVEDGDGAVPETSALGLYDGNGVNGRIPLLKNAEFSSYKFTAESFDDYIGNTFPLELAGAGAAYWWMTSPPPFGPGLPEDAAKWIQLYPMLSYIRNVDMFAGKLDKVMLAHGGIRKKHEFIENLMYEKPELTCLENDLRIATNNVAWSGLFLESISKNADIDFPGNVIADYTDASKHHADVLRVSVPSGSATITKYYERMTTVNPDFVKDESEETAEDILFKFDNFSRPVALRTLAVKAQSMIMRNVVFELIPEKMKELSYSYNFAAWKSLLPVGANGGSPNQVDRWGRTQTEVLDLAEGQNILTYKLANKVGMANRYFLRIIKSSTPMQVC
ncbi:MAG TPA: hypothetical protein DHV24_12305, partial [Candidatus Margulisbacteria bacterium]|nr:hypothetical protein [Candidatus Margulisiibacteriota bacterium]